MSKTKYRFKLPAEKEIPELLSKKWIEPKLNNGLIVHNGSCEVCNIEVPISTEVLRCIYCNVVAHKSCAQPFYSDGIIASPKMWICFYCLDYLDDSMDRFDTEKEELAGHDRRVQAQTIIAKYWRRYKYRSFYLRIYAVVVKLQVMYHVKHRKRDFMQNLQEKLRPIKLRVSRCTEIVVTDRDFDKKHPPTTNNNAPSNVARDGSSGEHYFYLVATVVDFFHGDFSQTWRMNSSTFRTTHGPDDKPFTLKTEETFVLGGVSGFNMIVLTLFQKGSSGRDYLVGQVHVQLSKDFLWRRGGRFRLPLGGQEFSIKDPSGMEMKADTRVEPRGWIDFEIVTFHGMHFECGPCFGSSLEDLMRTLYRLPACLGYSIAQHSSRGQTKGGNSNSKVLVNSGGTQNATFPMKRIWIAIAEGHLFAYSHYGDHLKLSLALAQFTPTYEFKDGHVVFNLHLTGYPTFTFYASVVGDTLRWKCAFLASLRFQPTIGNAFAPAVVSAAAAIAMLIGKSTVPFSSSTGSVYGDEDDSTLAAGYPSFTPLPVAPFSTTPSPYPVIHHRTRSMTTSFDMQRLVDDLLDMEDKLMACKGYRTFHHNSIHASSHGSQSKLRHSNSDFSSRTSMGAPDKEDFKLDLVDIATYLNVDSDPEDDDNSGEHNKDDRSRLGHSRRNSSRGNESFMTSMSSSFAPPDDRSRASSSSSRHRRRPAPLHKTSGAKSVGAGGISEPPSPLSRLPSLQSPQAHSPSTSNNNSNNNSSNRLSPLPHAVSLQPKSTSAAPKKTTPSKTPKVHVLNEDYGTAAASPALRRLLSSPTIGLEADSKPAEEKEPLVTTVARREESRRLSSMAEEAESDEEHASDQHHQERQGSSSRPSGTTSTSSSSFSSTSATIATENAAAVERDQKNTQHQSSSPKKTTMRGQSQSLHADTKTHIKSSNNHNQNNHNNKNRSALTTSRSTSHLHSNESNQQQRHHHHRNHHHHQHPHSLGNHDATETDAVESEAGNPVLVTHHMLRDLLHNQIADANAFDELVDHHRYQTVGEFFVQSMFAHIKAPPSLKKKRNSSRASFMINSDNLIAESSS